MFIQTEQTPNPATLKFLPGKVVMHEGTAFYQNVNEAENSPFAKRLFAADGVAGVFFGSDFITITKHDSLDWQTIKPDILGVIIEHYNSGGEYSSTIDPLMKKVGVGLQLTNQEKQDLIAFLKTLSDIDFISSER